MFLFSLCCISGPIYHHWRETNYALKTFFFCLTLKNCLKYMKWNSFRGYNTNNRFKYVLSCQLDLVSKVLIVDLRAPKDNLNSCSYKISCMFFFCFFFLRQCETGSKTQTTTTTTKTFMLLSRSNTSHSSCLTLKKLQSSFQFSLYPEAGVGNDCDINTEICFLFSVFDFVVGMWVH